VVSRRKYGSVGMRADPFAFANREPNDAIQRSASTFRVVVFRAVGALWHDPARLPFGRRRTVRQHGACRYSSQTGICPLSAPHSCPAPRAACRAYFAINFKKSSLFAVFDKRETAVSVASSILAPTRARRKK
jgi:hypothetical protein